MSSLSARVCDTRFMATPAQASQTALTQQSMVTLLRELLYGPAKEAAWVMNPGDAGLFASLDKLSAGEASAQHDGRSSIAAHVDHLHYGLSLVNRWVRGEENPFADADYSASWRRQVVNDEQWYTLRKKLVDEASAWANAAGAPRQWDHMTLTGALGSIVHLAYHTGAIRQIDAKTRGPRAAD
jgi:hypothetical protein